ncbi:MAG: carbon starvation protein A [Candidatus Aminicenantes bacterium]|nr:carbon starvation protein A [Candidatus Aminicenantes bacterium]
MLTLLFLLAIAAFFLAYFFYGNFLNKKFDLDNSRPTPAHSEYDGVDRVPADKSVLLGHHFSSIAGAGPIVGPIVAASAFGWGATLLWVVLGAIFIGGVHDFSAMIASIRHHGRSIANIARETMSPLAYKLMLIFIWLALIYVLVVFTDLTSATFIADGGVASSALMFILLAIGFGLAVYRFKIKVWRASLLFVPLVFLAIWIGQQIPIQAAQIPALLGNDPGNMWDIILILYCFIASTTPVWILLQPRDYLSSYLLYASVLGAFIGILFGGLSIHFPALTAWSHPQLGSLFPILFITVACGSCSGFHAIVASGTSSKQLDKETDTRLVGYGAMLIEGIVAVMALVTVMILVKGDPLLSQPPLTIYGRGMGRFLAVLGLPEKLGYSFGLLALSTFILTTLDTCTRLGRYIFEEFFSIKGTRSRYFSTIATLALPAFFVLINLRDAQGRVIPAWKAIWPVFGASNQLLAALTLLVITLWVRKMGKKFLFTLLPMLFMIIMTLWSLLLLINQYRISAIGLIAIVLLLLAVLLIIEAFRSLSRQNSSQN